MENMSVETQAFFFGVYWNLFYREDPMADLFINTAVLHIFDYSSGNEVMSQSSLNLEDAVIEDYVTKHLNKCINDIRIRKGYFNEGSSFLSLVQGLNDQKYNFTDFSIQAAGTLSEYLKSTASQSYDVLFADYRLDDVPYVAMILLENQKAYTHETKTEDGIVANTILLQHSILPSTGKKINTFALINTITMEIQYVDQTNWNNGDISVLQEMVLDCTSEKSREEVLDEVSEVVTEVAEKCDENPTLLLSKYKNYMKNSAEEKDTVSTEDLAMHVFNDSEELQDTFISTTVEHEIPKEVEVPKKAVSRKMKNQKIRTDTGIELTFPTEYSENPDKIEFINNPDGTISIEIKHIVKITNRG